MIGRSAFGRQNRAGGLVPRLALPTRIRPMFEPEPLILVEDGRVIEKNLREERMTPQEIAAEARLQQIPSVDRVQWAVLESGGRISFIPKT